jgi:hypothetical protein
MNYEKAVMKLEPTAKVLLHFLGDSEWVSVKRAPYNDADEIAYVIDGQAADGWMAAWSKLTGKKVTIPNRTGPGGFDYPMSYL